MARSLDKHANPEQIRTDVDCCAARPRLENGARSTTKISDVTGGGLYLLITPAANRPGKAGSKLWPIAFTAGRRPTPWGHTATVTTAPSRPPRPARNVTPPRPCSHKTRQSIPRSKSNSNGTAKQLSALSACGSMNGLRRRRPKDQARQTCHRAQSRDHRATRKMGRLSEGSFRQALPARHQAPQRACLLSGDAG